MYECNTCHKRHYVYNSCGDRHCPQCRGRARRDWAEQAEKVLHPNITYFQCIFTLPDRLSALVLGNRKLLYDLLFESAWQALNTLVQSECNIRPAATMVLHTWNQRLDHHPHVHAIVPGNGPSSDGQTWKTCRTTKSTGRPFLVDHERLGHRFRDHYLSGLMSLLERGKLRTQDITTTQQLILTLSEIDWAVYVQPPPRNSSRTAEIVRYLAQYMHGGPISDGRLIKVEADQVCFWARDKRKNGGRVKEKISGIEFVRRWALHILPKGYTKVRCFGAWAYTKRNEYLELCKRLCPAVEQAATQATSSPELSSAVKLPCPRCQANGIESELVLIERIKRPSWLLLYYGPDHPVWFERIYNPAEVP